MKSALARAGSMSKLRGPRSLNYTEGSPQKQTPKSVKFDKTDEVIHYDVMTPELTEEYWDQVSLQSCDSDLADRGEHDNRPLPAVPQFVLPSTLLRKEPASPLNTRRTLIGSPIADEDEDDFDFNLQQPAARLADSPDLDDVELPEPLQSPQIPDAALQAPSMSTRIDAMLAAGSGMSPSLRGTSGHRRTDSQMSDMSEASAPYLPLRSPQKYKPEEDEDDAAKWRDVTAAAVARQDSLQDSQRHPPTLKVSESNLPPPVDLERTYSKRRKELATMLDPRTSSTAHAVGTIPEEAEESEVTGPEQGLERETLTPEPRAAEPAAIDHTVFEQSSPLPQKPSPPHHHEITPLLSDDSQFIATQSSIPQSSSEVLQSDFDFGNDSFWSGGYLAGMRDDSRDDSRTANDTANDTANATIGISNEPAAQFAAGISPMLPEYTEDDSYVTQEEEATRSQKHVLPEIPPFDIESQEASESGEELDNPHMVRERSYLNIKDLNSEELDVGPALAPVRSDSDFFSLPPSPQRNALPASDTLSPGATGANIESAEEEVITQEQSTPQKPALQESLSTADDASKSPSETTQQSAGSASPAVTITPAPEQPSEASLPSPRGLPHTPARAQHTVPRVRVLPWDPSIENFQTSPIPVPDRSPKRQLSPQRGINTDVEAQGQDPSAVPHSDLQSRGNNTNGEFDDAASIDSQLQELMASTSMHMSDVSSEDMLEAMQLPSERTEPMEKAPSVAYDSVDARESPKDTSADLLATGDLQEGSAGEELDDKAVQKAAELEKPSIPAIAPTLSPVSFSPFVPSIPSSPVESSLKEPMAEMPAAGIDELVASPVAEQADEQADESSGMDASTSPSGQEISDVRAKSQDPNDSDTSVPGGQPQLDSDLSDFEVSPELSNEPSQGTLLRAPIDDQSAWESVSSRSPSESRVSTSTQGASHSQSPSQQLSEQLFEPASPTPQQSYSFSPEPHTHPAPASITRDVSLREPSFGESMSSSLQQMLSQRSELGSDTLERSYTLREYGSYVVATSPTRPQRRSQALEVIRDDSGSAYSAQLAIPRNRPLPTHSSLDQQQLRRGVEVVGAHDNMRAPSVISRTDSSSYSLATHSLSSQSHPSSTKGPHGARVASETKLGPIFEPEDDTAEHSLAIPSSSAAPTAATAPGSKEPELRVPGPEASESEAPEHAVPKDRLQPIMEPSLTESEDSMIAASSSKTGHEIRMLDQSFLQEDSMGPRSGAQAKAAADGTGEAAVASSSQYQPTIFPNGVLFLVVKKISLTKSVPRDTLVTLTLDNGVHCVTSSARTLPEIEDFGEEYRIGILDAPLSVTLRLCSPAGPIQVPELELGADGSFAKIDMGSPRTEAFGKRRELTLRGVNQWSTLGNMTVCSVDVSAMYIPCVSRKERLPSRLSDAADRVNEARGLLRERQARMQGVLRQFGGDIARHRGKQRWFVLDPVAPLLVAHSLRSHKARTLINLAKATSTAQVDSHKLEIRFRNQEALTFQVQSTLELAAWIRALRGCIGDDQNPRPKWVDAVIYESENGAISA